MSSIEDKIEALFQLKADFFPMTVVRLNEPELSLITKELEATISKAPKYLYNAPVVTDVRDMNKEAQSNLNLAALCQLFRDKEVVPVGIRGLHKKFHNDAVNAGLAVMKSRDVSLAEGHRTSPIAKQPEKPKVAPGAKVITRPIRSGSQVYAKENDLVVLAAINAGGECLADGNIHVYGPLRGRALAGASGNKNTHIFCETLEADLIAIAGHYLTKDQMKIPKIKKSMIHIYLKDDKLQIEGI
jgi:septum site-determining protein MinC